MQQKHYLLIGIIAIIGIILISYYVNQEQTPNQSNQTEPTNKSQFGDCPDGTLKHEGICKPKAMNLMAPDNLDLYIKNTVAHSRVYILDTQILINEAQKLTKGINDEYEKVRVIANWVRHSKDYANCSNCDSLLVAFESETGVCNEAALITVAMLRAVGIPSIPVGAPAHAFTAFNINNRWHGVDSTFCSDKNNCQDVKISTSPLLDSQGGEINSIFYTVDNLGSVENKLGKFCDSFGYCTNSEFRTSRIILQRNDIPTGEIIFPAIRRTPTISGGQISCALKPKNFKCDTTYGCYKFTGENEDEEVKIGPVRWNKEQWFEVGMDIGESPIGYLILTLPENEYVYRCVFQNGADIESRRIVAFREFYISPDSTTTITYRDLLRGDATEEEFLKLKDEIKNITEDRGIYP